MNAIVTLMRISMKYIIYFFNHFSPNALSSSCQYLTSEHGKKEHSCYEKQERSFFPVHKCQSLFSKYWNEIVHRVKQFACVKNFVQFRQEKYIRYIRNLI